MGIYYNRKLKPKGAIRREQARLAKLESASSTEHRFELVVV